MQPYPTNSLNTVKSVSEIDSEIEILKKEILQLGEHFGMLRAKIESVVRTEIETDGAIKIPPSPTSTQLGQRIREQRIAVESLSSQIQNLYSRIEL